MSAAFKLANFSDCHLGYSSTRKTDQQGINLRVRDGYEALQRIITEIIEEDVDAVIVPGDTFHVPEPKVRDIVFAQNQFRRFAEANIPVYILAGNHDALDLSHEIAASRVLHDPWRKIYSHVEPYVNYEIADGIHLHMISHHLYSEQAATMQAITPVEGEINILSTHGSVIDPIMNMKLHTEQSPREIVIPDFLINDRDWSYRLLGHIHERGWVGSKDGATDTFDKKTFYSGSLIRRGFSDKETNLGRGWTLWEIDSSGNFTPTFKTIPQRRQFDFNTIDASEYSASDITELIINNLKKTQLDEIGTEFDEKSAPLLRQKIINITPPKYSSLDWKNIEQQSLHAMLYGVKTTTADEIARENAKDSEGNSVSLEAGDVVKIYDDWVEKSTSLVNVDDDIKSKVTERARRFVKAGQEATLTDD